MKRKAVRRRVEIYLLVALPETSRDMAGLSLSVVIISKFVRNRIHSIMTVQRMSAILLTPIFLMSIFWMKKRILVHT